MYKRKPEGRKAEATKAKKVYNQYEDRHEDIANKLGISSSGANPEKIKFELNKIKHNKNLRKILKLTDSDFKLYGL